LAVLADNGLLLDCANDKRFQRGVKWLIDHQESDGSWHVTSRSKPFQEYFETGFPHAADQFISMSATCWSLLAIMAALPDETTTAETPTNDSQQTKDISAVLDQQVTAWNAGDLETFMSTYWHSDELSFSSGGRTTRGWQATFDRYRQRYPDRQHMGTLKISDLEITLLGESAAMVLGKWSLEREMDHPQGNFTLVVRQIDGNWRIIHDHTSLLEEAKEDNANSMIRRFEQLGAIPIRDNTRLIGFRFDHTKVTDADLQGIESLNDLTDLSLEQTSIGDEGIEHLRGLAQLEWLNLYRTQITDHGLEIVAAMPSIRYLPIGATHVSDAGLKHLSQMKKLRYLGLRGNAITDTGVQHLRELALLEGLHLGETQITDAGVQQLSALTGLNELYLQKTKITDESIDALAKMSGLQQLVLGDTQITADGVARLQAALPKCQIVTELKDEGSGQ
jgi:beta-aspartyl-peptidase (threonine type)